VTEGALTRQDVPAWIEGERLLVDEREGVGGIDCYRMDAKVMASLPHIAASFFALLPYKRKAGCYPRWNGFYRLLSQCSHFFIVSGELSQLQMFLS
jgi:hypothetical protein